MFLNNLKQNSSAVIPAEYMKHKTGFITVIRRENCHNYESDCGILLNTVVYKFSLNYH